MVESSEGWVATRLPCPKCDSSDAYSINDRDWGHCFSCGVNVPPEDGEDTELFMDEITNPDLIHKGNAQALAKRKLSEQTCKKWDYTVSKHKSVTCQVANYKNPSGTTVAQKIRYPDKTFTFLGDTKAAGLYGEWLWRDKGKQVVICEGELDALSISQGCFNNKWPVVSVPNGAQGATKAIKKSLEWLLGFETITFCFDNDQPGMEAAKACAALLPPRRAKIARLPLKDANEMLQAGRVAELTDAIWGAKEYAPDGIVNGEAIWERLINRPSVTSYPYPDFMEKMNQKTFGIRLGELDTFTSGSGMGKTTIIKQLQHHFHETTGFNQALIHLEETLEDTAEGLMGIHMGKRLNLPNIREQVTEADLAVAYAQTFGATDSEGNFRLNLYDAFGSLDEGDLYNKIRYFAHGLDCKIIWIDHLNILVSGLGGEGDERRIIDSIMHNLKSLTVELGIYIGLIVHLKKAPQGRSFEEGYVPNLDDLRGSGGIKQLSNSVFALSRNQQELNDVARNTSLITVLKCRYTGRTGAADYLLFDEDTGRMVQGSDPELLPEDDSPLVHSDDF
jgi:twinkle protein